MKFRIYGTEKVYYEAVIEASNLESLREMMDDGTISFDSHDIVDGENFKFDDIIDIIEE